MPDPNSLYYLMAKYALQVTSLLLTLVLFCCIVNVLRNDNTAIPYIISSAQAISCIALGVMSYHLRDKKHREDS